MRHYGLGFYDVMAIGAWVRANRVAKQWSQSELARELEIDSGTISRWERGEGTPRLEQFRRMCQVFKASADEALELGEEIRNSEIPEASAS